MTNSHSTRISDEGVARALAPFGVRPSAALSDGIREYIELLLRWNRKISLTSVTSEEEILQRHFGESMFGARLVPIERGRLIDVGSGAGFPGLPIKMISPELEVTLMEANQKKAAFLAELVRTLRLQGVRIIAKRIEELEDAEGGAGFVSCRAVRPDKSLLAWMHSVLEDGGECVLWLGAEDATTLRERPGWSWRAPIAVPLSSSRVVLVGKRR